MKVGQIIAWRPPQGNPGSTAVTNLAQKLRVLYYNSHVYSPNKPTDGAVVVETGLVTV